MLLVAALLLSSSSSSSSSWPSASSTAGVAWQCSPPDLNCELAVRNKLKQLNQGFGLLEPFLFGIGQFCLVYGIGCFSPGLEPFFQEPSLSSLVVNVFFKRSNQQSHLIIYIYYVNICLFIYIYIHKSFRYILFELHSHTPKYKESWQV